MNISTQPDFLSTFSKQMVAGVHLNYRRNDD